MRLINIKNMANNKRGKVKLGLIALEIALAGAIAYNVISAPPGSTLKPAAITSPKNLPGATAVSTVPVNPPDKLVVTMTPGGGTYTKNTTVKITSNVPCKIYWNAHGKDPRGSDGEPYTGPILLAGEEGKTAVYRMRFYGVHDFGIKTGVGAADFTIKRPAPIVPVSQIPNNRNLKDIARKCGNPIRIRDWVRYHISYARPMYFESKRSPQTVLNMGSANCVDGSLLIAAMCNAIGISGRGYVCGYRCCGYGHCIAQINWQGRTYNVDWLLCGDNNLPSELYPVLMGGERC